MNTIQGSESCIRSFELDVVDAYVHLLLTCNAFAPCDRKFQVFAIQDFTDNSSLKV